MVRGVAGHLLIKMTSDHSFKRELLMTVIALPKRCSLSEGVQGRSHPFTLFCCAYEFSDREDE
jgi:hypothetical protein